MIFVSTGGEKKQPIDQTIHSFYEAGIHQIELSGGPYFEPGLRELQTIIAKHRGLSVSVHNYFPAPQKPFVFNLASLNQEVFETSMQHALNAIRWAQELGSPYYSFHAGFLLDPHVSELGKKIEKRELFDRELSLQKFIKSVKELSTFAKSKNVKIFVENNVLSQKNQQEFKENPLLCVTPEETHYCMRELKDFAGLLVDVAHLKVSAKSLGFDPKNFLESCDPYIDAFHLSDNDGTADTNEPFDLNSWFFPFIKRKVSFMTIEVYKTSPQDLRNLSELISDK